MKNARWKKFVKWFELNAGPFLTNGRKLDEYVERMRMKYGVTQMSRTAMETFAVAHLGHTGKMISASKSGYCQRNPYNLVAFNACVCAGDECIWWGDLDVTLSNENLQYVADATGEEIYILRESDGRWLHDGETVWDNRDRAIAVFTPRTIGN